MPGDADRRDFGHGELHQEQEEGHHEAEGDERQGQGESRRESAKVTFHGTDPGNGSKGLRFKCKLDGKSFKSCSSPKTYKNLSSGKHTVQVKAIDKAGNVSKAVKKKFTV